jgi:hypothetical protein
MILGEFEPDVWIPSTHAAAHRGTISLEELARLDVIHGPRRAHAATYDAWTTAVQAAGPRFEFTDPPFHRSLPLTLAFAAIAEGPAAVLTGPATGAMHGHGLRLAQRQERARAGRTRFACGLGRLPAD